MKEKVIKKEKRQTLTVEKKTNKYRIFYGKKKKVSNFTNLKTQKHYSVHLAQLFSTITYSDNVLYGHEKNINYKYFQHSILPKTRWHLDMIMNFRGTEGFRGEIFRGEVTQYL